jgi:hypothetical protein
MTSPSFDRSSIQPAVSTPPEKMLALPRPGRVYTFDDIANLVWVNVLWHKSAAVFCLTQEILDLWLHWLERFPAELPALEVLDLDRATLNDWQTFLSRQSYDLTVLHGVCPELAADRISARYVAELVNAVPGGVVVLA